MGTFSKDKSSAITVEEQDYASSRYLPGQNRILHVYYENWHGRTARVMDEDKGTLLYEMDLRNRRPQITVRRAEPNNETVGTVNFHPLNRKVDLQVHDQSFRLKSKNWKYCDLQWESAPFGGQTLTWQRQTMWVVLDHLLLDENNLPVAKFSPTCSMKKAGRIELMDGGMSQEQLDEVVITGMAVMQDTKYYTCVNAGAAAA